MRDGQAEAEPSPESRNLRQECIMTSSSMTSCTLAPAKTIISLISSLFTILCVGGCDCMPLVRSPHL